jgi:hypothetical protein
LAEKEKQTVEIFWAKSGLMSLKLNVFPPGGKILLLRFFGSLRRKTFLGTFGLRISTVCFCHNEILAVMLLFLLFFKRNFAL